MSLILMVEDFLQPQGLEVEGALPEKVTSYEGVFYNYFSIGMLTWLVELNLVHIWFLTWWENGNFLWYVLISQLINMDWI